jgi:hypothetical protein
MNSALVHVRLSTGKSHDSHRVAISNRRLISADDKGVTFKWKPRPYRRSQPTISCLGAFRPPATRVRGETVVPAAENLHRSGR